MLKPSDAAPSRPHDPAFRKRQAAEYLVAAGFLKKGSPRTIDRYLDAGLLKPVALGPGLVGIRKSELDRLLSGDDTAPLPPKKPFHRPRDAKGRIMRAKGAQAA